MPLRDAGFAGYRIRDGYGFEARDGEIKITVQVTDRAVKLIRPAGKASSILRFNAYRSRFLAAASSKYDAGQFSPDSQVQVDGADVL